MEVLGLRETWEIMSDEQRESHLEIDMEDADLMNAYHDEDEDYDASVERGFF